MLNIRSARHISSRGLPAFLPVLWMATAIAAPCRAGDRGQDAAPFAPDAIQSEITYLASDALRGRGSGEPGNEMAARFVAQEFARDSIKPLGTAAQRDPEAPLDGSGYFQPFTFIAGRSVGPGNLLEVVFPGEHALHRYRAGQDFEPSGVSGGGMADGEVVFAGFGIHAPNAKHDDFEKVKVKGKIVLLLPGNPRDDPHSALAEYASINRKAIAARDLGAVAVLVVAPKDAGAPSRFAFADASDAGIPVLRVHRSLAGTLLAHINGQGLDAWEKAANEDKIVTVSTRIRVRVAADVKKLTKVTANVVGLIEGSDPVLKHEFVVIGAHLDHLGMGGPGSLARSDAPAIHHGADDNASGTAGIMQLARWFGTPRRDSPIFKSAAQIEVRPHPKRSIVLICFSGEELGLLGSDHYVKHPIIPLSKTVAMLNMDMVGRLRDNKLIVIGSGTATQWDSLLTEANSTAQFTLARSEDGFGASDQQSFYSKNIPVLFFFTGSHSDYHTPTDTADKINAQGESKVLEMVADCAERIADAPDRPTFKAIKVPSPGGSPGFRVYFGSVPDYAAMVEGVQLNGVRDGSPAAKAGLKAGDIIVEFGGKKVTSVLDYTYALQDHKPGDVVKIVVTRGRQSLTLTATLAARPE